MPRGIKAKQFDIWEKEVTLDTSGNFGPAAVTFREAFHRPPFATVVPHEGDDGTYSVTAITDTQFTLQITGSRIRASSGTIKAYVVCIAHEKM